MTLTAELIRILGCGTIIVFGISTWSYPINQLYGWLVIISGIVLYITR